MQSLSEFSVEDPEFAFFLSTMDPEIKTLKFEHDFGAEAGMPHELTQAYEQNRYFPSQVETESDSSPISSPVTSPQTSPSVRVDFPGVFGRYPPHPSDMFVPDMSRTYVSRTPSPTSDMEEIRELIRHGSPDKGDKGMHKGRRDINAKESQQEKHKSAEKKRRNEMNEVIDRLKCMLPLDAKENNKMTKISVLMETADYVQKVQDLCVKLLRTNRQISEENRRLNEEMMRMKSPEMVAHLPHISHLPPASMPHEFLPAPMMPRHEEDMNSRKRKFPFGDVKNEGNVRSYPAKGNHPIWVT